MGIGKKVAKTSFIYLFGQILSSLITFLLLPLYTNYISTEAYGMFDLFVAYAAVIVPLVGVDIWGGMLRFTLDAKDEKEQRHTIDTGIILLFCSMTVLSIMFFVVTRFIKIPNNILIYLYLITWMLQNFCIYTSRGFKRNLVFAISGIISAIAMATSALVCLFGLHLQIETLYISNIVSFISQVLFIELRIKIFRGFSIKSISKEKVKLIYKYCIPNSIGTIFHWLLTSVNRIIIAGVLGYTANGIFAISNKFISILSVFITVFMLAWQEAIFVIEDKNEQNKVYNQSFSIFIKVFGLAICIITAGTSIIFPYFIGRAFGDAYYLVPFFYIQFFASGLTWFLSSIVSSTKKTNIFLIEKFIISIINLSILWILIKVVGLYASPIAIFIAELVGVFIFRYFLRTIAGVEINIPMIEFIITLVGLGCSTLIYLFGNKWMNLFWAICVSIVGYLLFRSEILRIKNSIFKKSKGTS